MFFKCSKQRQSRFGVIFRKKNTGRIEDPRYRKRFSPGKIVRMSGQREKRQQSNNWFLAQNPYMLE